MKKSHLIAIAFLFIIGANAHAETHKTVADVMKADANKDGKVSFEEFKAMHEEKMIVRFKNKDINKDGFIDLEEKVSAKEKRQAEQQVEKEAERQALREKYQEDRKKRKKHFFKNQ